MDDVRDFLENKLKETRRERAPLEASAAELRVNLAATDKRIEQLAKTETDLQRALRALGKRERMNTTVTIKEAILQVLQNLPEGMTSNELVFALNRQFFDGELSRTSMSPQLTRLKRQHKIRSKGDRYVLA